MDEDEADNPTYSSPGFGRELNPSEYVDAAHDPDILYASIRNLVSKLETGLSIDTEIAESKVLIREKVEVFQLTMQYAEAFGLYLLHQIHGDGALINNVTGTWPGDLRQDLYRVISSRGLPDPFPDTSGKDVRGVLEKVFGYGLFTEVDRIEREGQPQDLDPDEIETLFDESISLIHSWLQRIARFYIGFGDLYNAAKHGDRVLPQPLVTYTIGEDPSSDTEEVEAGACAMFLCAGASQTDYDFVMVPADWLVERSLDIARLVHKLFRHLKDLSHRRLREEEELTLPAYAREPTEESTPPQWARLRTDNHVMIVPKSDALAGLAPDGPLVTSFRTKVSRRGNRLVLTSDLQEEPTRDYPFQAEVEIASAVGPRQLNIQGTIQTDLSQLDVCQAKELKDIADEEEEITQLVLEVEGEDTTLVMDHYGTVDFPDVAEDLGARRLDVLAILQRHIVREPIPMPTWCSQQQLDILDELVEEGTENLNKADLEDAAEQLQVLGRSNVTSLILIEFLSEEGTPTTVEVIGEVQRGLNEPPNFPDSESREAFKEYWGEGSVVVEIGLNSEDGAQGLVSELREVPERGLEIIEELEFPKNGPEGDSEIRAVLRDLGQGFWYGQRELRFRVPAPPPRQA